MDAGQPARRSSRNDDYWGETAKLDSLIFRPIPDNAARLQALQTGEIQGYDLVEPQDIPTIEGDSNLQILDRPAFNVGYVGINQAKPPMDKLKVRQAVAYGLDRQAVVDNFYGGRGEVATQFMPPEVIGYADDVTTYDYDPEKSKQLLQDAGLTLPGGDRVLVSDRRLAAVHARPEAQLRGLRSEPEQVGLQGDAEDRPVEPGLPGPRRRGQHRQVYLLGWTGDFGDPDNFVGTFFQTPAAGLGTSTKPSGDLGPPRTEAETETDEAKREALYEEANRADHGLPPRRAVRALQPALAFIAERRGLRAEPGLARVVRAGHDRGIAEERARAGGRRCCASSSAGSSF